MFVPGNKKDVGVCSSAPIPILRLSHCLFLRISNASQPTPSDIIKFSVDVNHQSIKIATNSWDIIHPRERFVALSLCTDSNLRDLTTQTGNVQKTPFPFGLPYKWHRWPPDSIDVKYDPPLSFLPQSLYNQGCMDWHSLLQIYEIFLNDI